MAADGGDAAREAVLDDRRHRQHDVDESSLGLDADHASSSRSTATSTPPRRTCRRRSRRRCAACRRASSRRRIRRRIRPTRRSSTLALTSNDDAALAARRVRRDDRSRSGSRWWRAWRRCRCSARRSTRCACSSIPTQLADARHRHRRGRDGDRRSRTSTCRPACSTGPNTALTVQATGQLAERGRSSGSMVVAYRNGAPVHLDELGRVIDDVQNNKTASWYNGDARDRARRSSASRARTRSRSRTRSRRCSAQLQRADPAGGQDARCSTTARRRSRSRCTT